MPDFFKVTKSAVYVGATTDNLKRISKNSGGALHYRDARDVDLKDPEISAGKPLTTSKGHWLVSEDSASVMVESARVRPERDPLAPAAMVMRPCVGCYRRVRPR